MWWSFKNEIKIEITKISFFSNSRWKKFTFTIWGMLEKLACTRSKLGPKLRAEAHTRSSSGFQYSYSLSARDFDARPIPKPSTTYIKWTLCFINIWSLDNLKNTKSWLSILIAYLVSAQCKNSIFCVCTYFVCSWQSTLSTAH